MRVVDSFSAASGLGVNRDKTLAISAKPSSFSSSLSSSPWPLTKVVKQTVYLGVLFGRSVTTKNIFADALSGLIERAHLFTVSIKALSHHNRVVTVLTFLSLPSFPTSSSFHSPLH